MANICKNHETKADKLIEMKYEDLRACNCERCEPLADRKELDSLRSYQQESEVKKAALEEGKRIAQEIIETGKAVDGELKGMMKEVVEEELKKAGLDMNGRVGRVIEQKMQFDLSSPMVNTKYGREQLSPGMKSFVHWAKTGEAIDRKALGGSTASAGGYLVPEEFRAEVIRKVQPLTVVRRSGARAFTISRDSVDIPVVTGNSAGGWKAESTAYQDADPTFGNVNLTPHKYTRITNASYEMLEDSAINVADLLSDIFAEDFASAEDSSFVNGDGATANNKPSGIGKDTNVSIVTAATTISADNLLSIVYALPRQYRNGAVWYLNAEQIQAVRKLKDANGDMSQVWSEGNLINGEPARLLGYPVFETNDLTSYDKDGAGAGTQLVKDVIFCNPKYYYIADRQGMRLERSTERYFELGQVAFRADMRVDGKIALADAFVKAQINVTA